MLDVVVYPVEGCRLHGGDLIEMLAAKPAVADISGRQVLST